MNQQNQQNNEQQKNKTANKINNSLKITLAICATLLLMTIVILSPLIILVCIPIFIYHIRTKRKIHELRKNQPKRLSFMDKMKIEKENQQKIITEYEKNRKKQ